MVFTGEKRLLLLLEFHPIGVTGASADGETYSAADVEKLVPQAIDTTVARLERMPGGK
ncbi:hypothetical protein [Leisingera methylohalidivorans]|uniref:Uncharacterized protein n=1 Tax=Leisingera methylohalidivorans DSM 14336 TaxID=999552 RepID=V9W245_9RHOB|nr:hypothetical protein METH_23140 [Leisingera methylohalidivorans DSM 14336]